MTASAPVTETGSDRVETTAADRASRRGWPGGALVLAALVVVPIGFLAIGILDPETEVWRQQWDTRLPGQLVDTAVLLVGVSFGALFLGSSLAWLVSAYRFPGSKAFGWLLVAPLAMPSYVLGFVTMSVFGFTGPVQNQWRDWFGRDAWFPEVESMGGAIVVFTLVLYPYVFLLARAALADQAGSAYNVARSLGAGPLEAARRVVIPMLRPALAAGVAVVMMETITDFATVRPLLRLDENGSRNIIWPTVGVWSASLPGTDVVMVLGPEPALRWRTFTEQITAVAQRVGAPMVITLGALLADVPHTRPVHVIGTASDDTLMERYDLERSRYEGPTGIVGVIQDSLSRAGFPGASLWAAVPGYTSQIPSPKAALALVERVCEMMGTPAPTADLADEAADYDARVEALISDDDDLVIHIEQLEEIVDEM
ncbi:MAG: ABC transporter permease subunit, partial [Actinobacteria bacterium]|nr:ABC transporter permease subunit [Actinomycetota bacterium]